MADPTQVAPEFIISDTQENRALIRALAKQEGVTIETSVPYLGSQKQLDLLDYPGGVDVGYVYQNGLANIKDAIGKNGDFGKLKLGPNGSIDAEGLFALKNYAKENPTKVSDEVKKAVDDLISSQNIEIAQAALDKKKKEQAKSAGADDDSSKDGFGASIEKFLKGFMDLFSGKSGGGFGGFLAMLGKLLGFSVPDDNSNAADNNNTPADPSKLAQASATQLTGPKDAQVQVNVHKEEIIEGTLSGLSNIEDAKKLSGTPGLAFSADGGKTYVPASDDKSITAESLKNVQIVVDGQKHYFKKIDGVDGTAATTATGLKASAWVETDDKGEMLKNSKGQADIHIAFGGYTGSPLDNSPQTQSLMAVVNGDLNPQTAEVAKFTHDVIAVESANLGGKDKISGIVFGSHSLGGTNALTAQTVAGIEGVTSEATILLEPVAASLAKSNLQKELSDQNSALYSHIQTITGATNEQIDAEVRKDGRLDQDIANKTISIRSVYAVTDKSDDGKDQTTLYESTAASLNMGNKDEVKSQVMAQMSGTKAPLDLNGADNPNNAMVGGIQIYQNVTPLQTKDQFDADKSDALHRLSNLVIGEAAGGANNGSDYYSAQKMMKDSGVIIVDNAADVAVNPPADNPKGSVSVDKINLDGFKKATSYSVTGDSHDGSVATTPVSGNKNAANKNVMHS